MGIAKTLPKNAKFIQTVNLFTATFNVPTVGVYDWTVAANQGVNVINLDRKSVYFIDRINFACDISEGDFLAAINTIPTFHLRLFKNRHPVYVRRMPLGNYVDNQETNTFFGSKIEGDQLIMDFNGILNQTAPLVGDPTIVASVSLNVYQIDNTDWVDQYHNPSRDPKLSVYQ